MPEDAWVGIDLGTQSARVHVLGDDGTVLATAAEPLTSIRRGDRHEQDPAEWRAATWRALARATGELPAGARVRGLSISGTSGTIVPLHPDGSPAGMAAMYDDRRGAAVLDEVQQAGAAVWDRLGTRMQATWGLPKLVAMLRSGDLPGNALVAHQPDVIASALTGARTASDLSSALKSGVDLDRVAWPGDVLDRLGVPAERMNAVAASGTVIGTVSSAAAQQTGLTAGASVVAGFTDGCAAQIAAGAVAPGTWNSVLGTTLVIKGTAAQRRADPSGAVYAHRAAFDGGWYPGGASSTGAGSLSAWLPDADLTQLTARAAERPDIPAAYPLAGHGERFPFVADDAHAFGVPGRDDPVGVFSAVAHGVAFVERLAYALLDDIGYDTAGPVLLTGGGARNPWWNSLRAAVLGRPVAVPGWTEGAAGMALLAAAAVADAGAPDPLAAAAARMQPASRVVEPSDVGRGRLEDAFAAVVEHLAAEGWLSTGVRDAALAGIR